MSIEKYSFGIEGNPSMSNNVKDIYKTWTAAEIRADLQEDRMPIVMICHNLDGGFNISSVIRAANAFLAQETYIVGRRRFDARGGVGMRHYEHIYHADTMEEVISLLQSRGYSIYAVDNIEEYNPVSLWDCDMPMKSAFILGNESVGLDKKTIDMTDGMVYINQYGAVRSLNVAQAGACIFSEYARRFRR